VLDRIFGLTTARDIDLVISEGEMPAILPEEVLQSPLPIETLWVPLMVQTDAACHNINLPRITESGMTELEVTRDIVRRKVISVLPGRRKLSMSLICSAVKAMVKYGMQPDDRTLKVWTKSIQSPPGLKKSYEVIIRALPIKSVNWGYVRADHFLAQVGRAYQEVAADEQRKYFASLRNIVGTMGLSDDVAFDSLLGWLDAAAMADERKKHEIEDFVRTRQFKFKRLETSA